MENPESDRNEISSLNASIAIETGLKNSKDIPINGLQTNIDNEKHQSQNHIGSTKRLGLETAQANGVKSYYSSINNLLPCSDADIALRSHHDERLQTNVEEDQALETSLHIDSSSRKYSSSATKPKKTLEQERIFVRQNAKPPLNPAEIAKGLSSLHSKIDELLKKRSIQRIPRESVQPERILRALSNDSRTILKPAPQAFMLNRITREATNADLPSDRSCYSIAIDGTKQQNELNFTNALNDYRETVVESKVLKTQSDALQDSFSEERQSTNMAKKFVFDSPKNIFSLDLKSLMAKKVQSNDLNIDGTEGRSQQDTQVSRNSLTSGVNKIHTDISPNNRIKPKYDEKKLNDIISKIRERNSVSPSPELRRKGDRVDLDSSQRYSVNYSGVGRSSINIDQRANFDRNALERRSLSQWTALTKALESEKSSKDDAHDVENLMKVTAINYDAKIRSVSSPKFREADLSNGFPQKDALQYNTTYKSQYENQPNRIQTSDANYSTSSHLPDDLNRKTNRENSKKINSSSTNLSNILESLQSLRDIKSLKIKTYNKDVNDTPSKFHSVLDKSKNVNGFSSEYKPRIESKTNMYRNSFTAQKSTMNSKGILGTSELSMDLGRNSQSYFCGEVENDIDSVVGRYTNKSSKEGISNLHGIKHTLTGMDNASEENSNAKRPRVSGTKDIFGNIDLSQNMKTDAQRRYSHSDNIEQKPVENSSSLGRKSVEKVEKVNDKRMLQGNIDKYKKDDHSSKVYLEGARFLEPEQRHQPFLEALDKPLKNELGEHSPIRQCDEELLTLDGSVFSLQNNSNLIGEIDTNRLFGSEEHRVRETNRPQFNTLIIKERFLEDNEMMSDFDFDRNRLETQEQDLSVENERTFKLKHIHFGDNERVGAKRHRISDKDYSLQSVSNRVNEQLELKNRAVKSSNLMDRYV